MKSKSKIVKIHQNKAGKKQKAPVCPYCGRRSVLRPAEYVYGDHTIDSESQLYVCSGYPECRAYVGVHKKTKKPKGTLANSELRNKRIRAHQSMDRLVKSGYMSRDDVYFWLSCRMNLPFEETHIGYFSDYYCDRVIEECEQELERWKGKKAA